MPHWEKTFDIDLSSPQIGVVDTDDVSIALILQFGLPVVRVEPSGWFQTKLSSKTTYFMVIKENAFNFKALGLLQQFSFFSKNGHEDNSILLQTFKEVPLLLLTKLLYFVDDPQVTFIHFSG